MYALSQLDTGRILNAPSQRRGASPLRNKLGRIKHLQVYLKDQEATDLRGQEIDLLADVVKREFRRSQVTKFVNNILHCNVKLMSLRILYLTTFTAELSDIINSPNEAMRSKPDYTIAKHFESADPIVVVRLHDGSIGYVRYYGDPK